MRFLDRYLLLINPWIYDFSAYDLWSKPLGLLYLASFLRDQGFSIDYVDCLDTPGEMPRRRYGTGHFKRTPVPSPPQLQHIPRQYARYGMSEEQFYRTLYYLRDPQVALVSSHMTYWYPGPRRIVEIIREKYPDIPVILGGVYASLMPEHAKREVKPDYIITGPGERALIELLNDLLDLDIPPESIPEDPDQLPYPALEMTRELHYLNILTSRGCPYDCSFCAQKLVSTPFRQRDPDAVVDELDYQYRRMRYRDIAFYDDALFVKRDHHIKPILEGIIRSRMPLRLHSPNGLFAREIDAELAVLMFRAGFKTIRLSYETVNENRQAEMHHKVSDQGMIDAVDHLERAGYRRSDLEAYVIMGLPGQNLEEILASMIFVNNLGVRVRLASYSPIPGTTDFDRAVESGYIPADIDPLLTNKTIYPLSGKEIRYETYRDLRTFSHFLNDAAGRNMRPFAHGEITPALRHVLNGS